MTANDQRLTTNDSEASAEDYRRHGVQASADVIRAGITLLLLLICGYLGWHIVRAISSGAVQRAIEGVR